MINTRWASIVIALQIFGFILSGSPYDAVFLMTLMITAIICLLFHPHQLKLRAYRVFTDPATVYKFEEWIQNKPELAEAIKWAHALSPDDFMTFCRLLVEVRYQKDQNALELVSQHFRREK
jgi:hypothetical protein